MKEKRINKIFFITAFFLVLINPVHAKKTIRPMKFTNISEAAGILYETANSEIASSDYLLAESHLEEACVKATSVDNKSLLCKINLSKAVLNHYLSKDYSEYLKKAKYFAALSDEKDLLTVICNLYEADFNIENYSIDELKNMEGQLKKSPYYYAFFYRVQGNWYAKEKDYSMAEKSFRKAAEIHTKECYLTEIGMDWYQVARMNSLLGDKEKAVSSIDNAIRFDKDSENSAAIANDYFAKAIIYSKNNPTEEEKNLSKQNALWAQEIFKAAGFEENSRNCQNLIDDLEK